MNSELLSSAVVRIPRLQKQGLASVFFDGDPRAVVITAPAGYGKSCVLDEIAEHESAAIWRFTPTANDSDAHSFRQTLAHAAGLDVAAVAQDISLAALLAPRLNAAKTYLLIDNIDVLAGSASADLLAALLLNCPENLTVVLAGRRRIFSITELLLTGACRAVDAAQLGFSLQETQEWLTQAGISELSSLDVQALQQITRGWPAGLRFLSLDRAALDALAVPGDEPPLAPEMARYFDVVLREQLGEHAVSLLQRMAILLRFDAGLMQAVVGDAGADLFEQLCEQNLFISSQDTSQRWYEFHPLAKAYLMRCFLLLPEAERRQCYTQAFEWCLVHGLVDDAVEYGLRADNVSQIAALLDQQLASLTANGLFPQVERWLNHATPALFAAHPKLLVYRCWALTHMGRCFEADRYLEQLAQHLKVLPTSEPGTALYQELMAIGLVNAVTKDDLDDARARLQEMDLEAMENAFSQGACHNSAAIVHWLAGDIPQAHLHVERALEAHQRSRSTLGQVYSLCIAALLSYQQMALYDCLEQLDAAELLLRKNAISEDNVTAALPKVLRAAVLYAWNQTDEAYAILMAILPQLQQCAYLQFKNLGFLTLSRILCRREQFAQALDVLSRSEQANAQCLQQRSQAQLGRQRLQILLRSGDLDAAEQFLRQARIKLQVAPALPAQWEGISVLRSHMYCLYSFAVEPREELLDQLRAMGLLASKASRRQHALEYALLEVRLLLALGRADEASQVFAEQLQMLMEEDCIAPLLESDSYQALCEQLLLADGCSAGSRRFLRRVMATGSTASLALADEVAAVDNPLSAQEQRVLRLIERGLPNKRIGSELGVSVNTVRWHISNLLGKLQVANRTEAVAQARRCGYL